MSILLNQRLVGERTPRRCNPPVGGGTKYMSETNIIAKHIHPHRVTCVHLDPFTLVCESVELT
jgi:hypothetical protein